MCSETWFQAASASSPQSLRPCRLIKQHQLDLSSPFVNPVVRRWRLLIVSVGEAIIYPTPMTTPEGKRLGFSVQKLRKGRVRAASEGSRLAAKRAVKWLAFP